MQADAGGCNGHRPRVWKYGLQQLANETGLTLTVCHYPTGASKWNPIEHQLFSQISRNWAGVPLRSYDILLGLIRGTLTDKGLIVDAIADRIEEFESSMEMPFISIPERLRGLMEIKNLKQSDLKEIAPQSVISDILNGKREVNLNQAKGFASYFGLPIYKFIAA